MEPIKPAATLTGNTGDQHSPADGDAASATGGELPFHLTEKILCRISPLESVRLAAVCKSWAATVSERLATPTPHLLALEILDDKQRLHRGAIFSFPIVDQEESTSPEIPARLPSIVSNTELFGTLPCGSLCFADDSRVVLANPVTSTLQSINMYGHRDRSRSQMKPIKLLRTAAGANAIFVADYAASTVSLLWCEEEEEQWSERKLLLAKGLSFSHADDAIRFVAYSDGIFYTMDVFGCIHILDMSMPPPQRLTSLGVPSILWQNYGPWYIHLCNSHLLASEGEVLFLRPVFAPREPLCPISIGGFEIYRLDVQAKRWVKMERLADDRALFVSEQSSLAVRASETPGCMANCIYFVSKLRDHFESHRTWVWGVYSMEEQKVLFQRSVGGSPGKYKAARWFFPRVGASPARSSGKKRRFQMLGKDVVHTI